MATYARGLTSQAVNLTHTTHWSECLMYYVANACSNRNLCNWRVYFISATEGVAQASDLDLNEWGEIENWPDKFFGDEVGEIVAITQNALRRRMDLSE